MYLHTHSTSVTATEDRFRETRRTLQAILTDRNTGHCDTRQERFVQAKSSLESLPIIEDDYCFLSNWLKSAFAYLTKGEPQAARYQIAAMLRRLDAVEARIGF